ncbi:MAG: hypothetical protein AB8B96_20960 [Lysobacterales bacterium]
MNPTETRPPIAISYRPKANDYLPVVVASIRHHLGDWPIALLTEKAHLPPLPWLHSNQIQPITDWSHSPRANKVLRLWEHQTVFSQHFPEWIWWHDDMVLLRSVDDPETTFARPLIARRQRRRPNKELTKWHTWLWDTLSFFRCQNVYAPNPVLHVPRLITRKALAAVPENWNRSRLLFEPTYLLWHWHQTGANPILAPGVRQAVFKGQLPSLCDLEDNSDSLILTFGRKVCHDSARAAFSQRYPVEFTTAIRAVGR